jgi:hypothetical protein
VSDFGAQFKTLSDTLGQAAQGLLNKVDQWSFRMLVDNLKQSDYEAVKESIDQLAREKKPLAIPPLFFVSKVHPNPFIREAAEKALHEFDKDKEIKEATDGKPVDDATKFLIEKFGNFRG